MNYCDDFNDELNNLLYEDGQDPEESNPLPKKGRKRVKGPKT